MTIKKLHSGYWHVRFGRHRFVQWAVGTTPTASDTFGFSIEDKEDAALRAAELKAEMDNDANYEHAITTTGEGW